MARYTGPKTKISRIFGEPILGNAKWLGKNSNPPGQHGAQRKRKQLGEYALQLSLAILFPLLLKRIIQRLQKF